mmetsp:Transcript_10392/g.19454  ORF Transcript_10392/g.19454 Transcript_10392/m.19454 type:complete len:156 (+) Transcript_10392:340-807(+)
MDDIPDISDTDYDRRGFRTPNDAYYSELMAFLSESHSMRKTAKSAVKQSLYAASGAFAGSFIGGPIGGLVGGIAGSLIGFLQSDEYDGAIVALTKLDESRRKRLMLEVLAVLKQAGVSYQRIQDSGAFRETLYQFAEQENVRNGIWNACLNSAKP